MARHQLCIIIIIIIIIHGSIFMDGSWSSW